MDELIKRLEGQGKKVKIISEEDDEEGSVNGVMEGDSGGSKKKQKEKSSILEAKLKELKSQGIQPKLFYTIPNFQNPSGFSTTLERRQRIAELAQEYGIIVLEDDAYHDLRFKGDPIPPIYTLDQSGSVWYTATA